MWIEHEFKATNKFYDARAYWACLSEELTEKANISADERIKHTHIHNLKVPKMHTTPLNSFKGFQQIDGKHERIELSLHRELAALKFKTAAAAVH